MTKGGILFGTTSSFLQLVEDARFLANIVATPMSQAHACVMLYSSSIIVIATYIAIVTYIAM